MLKKAGRVRVSRAQGIGVAQGNRLVSLSPLLPCGLGGGLLTTPSLISAEDWTYCVAFLFCCRLCHTKLRQVSNCQQSSCLSHPRADKGQAIELTSHLLLALCHVSCPGLLSIHLQGR